jgi:hypothetical protein
MLDRWLGIPAHYYLHLVGAILIAVGLPLNKVVMSIGSIWLISNVVLEANYTVYYHRLKSNPLFLVIFAIFLLHLVGLLWTTDFDYALRDIKTKLPFLTIPLALFVKPIPKEQLNWVLGAFVGTALITSAINIGLFYIAGNFSNGTDIRELSLFGSHIRYGLVVLFAAVVSLSLPKQSKVIKVIGVVLCGWFLLYTLVAQVLSANVALILLILGMLLYALTHIPSRPLKVAGISVYCAALVLTISAIWNVFQFEKIQVDLEDLPTHTVLGNPYYHDVSNQSTENGHHIMSYIQENELNEKWGEVSTIPYHDGLDAKGQPIMGTLIRYMTSKGLTKDAKGFESLSQEDINHIEKGIPSIRYTDYQLLKRLDGLKFQIQNYQSGGTSSGHSLLQRFEHWRAAGHIIRENWLIGVGTGDVQEAFYAAYADIATDLPEDQQNRAHNQFMTFWATFGIFGFLLFVAYNVIIFRLSIQSKSFIAIAFTILAFSSFLPEDTIETQQGVTFIAFFTGVLPAFSRRQE